MHGMRVGAREAYMNHQEETDRMEHILRRISGGRALESAKRRRMEVSEHSTANFLGQKWRRGPNCTTEVHEAERKTKALPQIIVVESEGEEDEAEETHAASPPSRRTVVLQRPPRHLVESPAMAASACLWTSARLRERPLHDAENDGEFARNHRAITSSAEAISAFLMWKTMRCMKALAFMNNQPVTIANWLDMDHSGSELPLRRLRKDAAAAGTLRAPCQWPAVATVGFLESGHAGGIGHFVSVLASYQAHVVTIVDSLKSGSDDASRPALRAFYGLSDSERGQPFFCANSRRPVEKHFVGIGGDIARYAPVLFRVVRYLALSAALARVAAEGGDWGTDGAAVQAAYGALKKNIWEVRVYSHASPQTGLDCGPLSLALLEKLVTSKVPVDRMISEGTTRYRTNPAYAKGLGAASCAELTVLPSQVPASAATPAREFLHRTSFKGGHHWLDACKPRGSVMTAIDEAVALHSSAMATALAERNSRQRPRVSVHLWGPLPGPNDKPSAAAEAFVGAIAKHLAYLQWAHRGCDIQVHRRDLMADVPMAAVERDMLNARRRSGKARGTGGALSSSINVFFASGDAALVYQLPFLQSAAALAHTMDTGAANRPSFALTTVVAASLPLKSGFLSGSVTAPFAARPLHACLKAARQYKTAPSDQRDRKRLSVAFVEHSAYVADHMAGTGAPGPKLKSSAASYGPPPPGPPDLSRPLIPCPQRVLGSEPPERSARQHTFCLSVAL